MGGRIMRNWRRVLCVCLVLSLLLPGCSRLGNKEPALPVTLTLWNYYIGEQKKAFDALVEEFNLTVGQESGVVVEANSKADVTELSKKLSDAANGEPGAEPLPDIFFAYADVAYALAKRDLLVDYRDYVDKKLLQEYVPGFLREGELLEDDRLFILPAAKSTEVVIVNRTYFDEFCEKIAATPGYEAPSIDDFQTWEGILRAGETYYNWTALHEPDSQGNGRALFGIDSLSNYLFSSHRQLGFDMLQQVEGKGVARFDTGVFDRVWRTYYDSTVKGYFASFGRFRSDDMKTGDILAYLGATTSSAYLGNEVIDAGGHSVPVEYSVLPMPVFEGGRPVAVQQGAGMAMTRSTKEKEKAGARFVTWFSEPERNQIFAVQSGYLPVRTEAIRQLSESYGDSVGDEPIEQTLITSLKQVNSGYEMYTTDVFDAVNETRVALESELQSYAAQQREQVLEEIRGGAEYDEAVSRHTTELQKQAYMDLCEERLLPHHMEVLR